MIAPILLRFFNIAPYRGLSLQILGPSSSVHLQGVCCFVCLSADSNSLQQCTGHASPLACLSSDELSLAVSPCVSPSQCRVSLTQNQLAFGYWLMKTRLTVFSLCTWYQ